MIKIMIVEDDLLLRNLISSVLKRNNFITYEAVNGVKALETK